jgi:hypothetical protein
MMSKLIARLLAALLLAFSGTAARADIFQSADFSISAGEEPNSYELTAQLPGAIIGPTSITLPEGCTQRSVDRQPLSGRNQFIFEIQCDRRFRASDVIQTPWPVDGASFVTNVMGAQVNRSLQGTEDGVAIPIGETVVTERSFGEIAKEYLWQGMLHIWMGWDHLAFVLCLCLLTRGKQLLWLVTAFTGGHSISLALAFFQVVNIPVPPVEAVIALSIAFMAREALRSDGMSDTPVEMRRHVTVVALFGLLHGLGFASALGELGVQPTERVPGLVFFNLGVEAGQLAFVAVVALVMMILHTIAMSQPVRVAALYGVGILGCFWMVERVAAFQWV